MDTHPSLLSLLSRDLTVVTWDQAKKGEKKKKKSSLYTFLISKRAFLSGKTAANFAQVKW